MDLFSFQARTSGRFQTPLPERMRPKDLDHFIGQTHLIRPGTILRTLIENDRIFSMCFWGPPGSGKTTLAHIISRTTNLSFIKVSAVSSGLKELREAVKKAEDNRKLRQLGTLLFIDELHRFSKSIQDFILPYVENGTLVLIGATTENPGFRINNALLSRVKVFRFNPLTEGDIRGALIACLSDDRSGLTSLKGRIPERIIEAVVQKADGDLRQAYNMLDFSAVFLKELEASGEAFSESRIEAILESLDARPLQYDRDQDWHYEIISAFQKSLRGSDPDGALYWYCRMIEAGEDPIYLLRRLVVTASEDVGNADPNALNVALNALRAYETIGMPEAEICISQAVTYVATAPKSNSSYLALKKCKEAVKKHGSLPVPTHLRNAPTRFHKEMGYKEGYLYPHDFENGYTPQQYLPDALKEEVFYEPKPIGREAYILRHMDFLRKGGNKKNE